MLCPTETFRKHFLSQGMSCFKSHLMSNPSKVNQLSQSILKKKISQEDMRKEMVKIEGWYDDLHTEKLNLLNLSSSEDLSDLVTQFDSLVVKELDKCKAIALEYLKDVPATLTPSVEGDSVSSRGSFSTTKRETVMLPQFSGDEKTAYLCYPVWKQAQESLAAAMSLNSVVTS